MSNDYDSYDEADDTESYEPGHAPLTGRFADLEAIREEPNQTLKQRMLEAYERKFGYKESDIIKRWVGIHGY